MADWSFKEDRRPAPELIRPQPEITARGRVWTQLVEGVEINGVQSYTQLKIRECSGDVLVDHGRIWPVVDGEDGA